MSVMSTNFNARIHASYDFQTKRGVSDDRNFNPCTRASCNSNNIILFFCFWYNFNSHICTGCNINSDFLHQSGVISIYSNLYFIRCVVPKSISHSI
uniref:Uncharacterized protein n=1 Tax=Siphoviridae sp. ctLqe90 TaxID=2825456 RepID=A0A8S5Q2I0_9CAUD|nr:MAG TPA: hypothetical protein [Siphoviridae sp. ctLqe90]